jgi:predicted nuclease of predicted toxin-antitoxin system
LINVSTTSIYRFEAVATYPPDLQQFRDSIAAVSDERIWQFAKSEGFAIVSMDEDFRHLSARFGFPPKVVWVRLGNVRRQALLGVFAKLLPELRAGLEGDTVVIEVR